MSLNCTAPGKREPSVKKMVGVPVMPYDLASARFLSIGVVHSPLPLGVVLLMVQSIHAFVASAEHQICFDFCIESAERIGNKKVYTVTLSSC